MTNNNDSLSKWFSGRPRWLQIAATRLLQQSELSDKDISDLATLCQQEADRKLPQTTCSFPATAFSQGAAGILRLCSISDVEGVNALAPKKPLEFGKGNITIVYGNNGSGKSGYVRLLKHVCGARETGALHHNVYKSSSAVQRASISFEQDGIPKTHTWSGQGICDDLGSVDIFDTSFGKVFVSSDDEVSYEPPVLSFFSSLIVACEKVASTLDAEANRHQSKKPNIPADKKVTPEGIWYEAIGAKTGHQDIDKNCTFSSVDESEIQTLEQRLTEQAPTEKAKQLRKQKQHIDTLIQDSQKHLKQLSDANFRRIIAAKKKSILKKTAADTAAEKVFSGSELEGIGSDVWKELWEAARNYSVTTAYKEAEYPNVSGDSRCVLCHQTLTQEAKERLISFENFVKGEMQKIATDAAKEYETAIQTIEEIPTSETLRARVDAAGIPQEEVASQVTDFFVQLRARKELLSEIDSEEAIPDPLLSPKWIEEAGAQSKHLGELAENYDEDAKRDNREEIKKKLNSLQARKWLSEHRAAIDDEVTRLKLLKQIQEGKKLTNTKALSQKKGELAEALITDAFVQRFNAELRALGASQVKVEIVKSRVSKGRVLHKLQLRGASQSDLSDVLSEGENRIVSIAAFLADVTGKSNQAPFVFDDPISSLDQTYEEAVVQRLIELSQDKQVIVFTHRLSLLGTVRHFAEKKTIKPDVVSIRSTDWGTGEPAHIPLSQSDIKSALNTLINQRYQDAKKASDNGEFQYAEILLKSMCSDFRSLVERSIENDLLCGVVQRFQRPVHTLKLKDLAKLKAPDCDLLDSLMTKYSGFEHSQPTESPVEMPKPDELLADMNALKSWREEYAKRAV
ncbi:AAA family ATPase [Halomonas kalidii]|uniref:AAA family ATPase n=1 Tax=Halomonas kalidii TaxID=3043293 RepID=A0ABT6VL54_9GAMM|nr:AAA family ATPase [Halomonas kalidii]MDI5934679.1 AAA family ATPase [Halomonas kalidii]